MPTLADLITARAAELGQSDVKISRILNVDPSTVNRWRNGTLPRRELIPAIAGWLDVNESVVVEAMYANDDSGLDQALADEVRQLTTQVAELARRVSALEAGRSRGRRAPQLR